MGTPIEIFLIAYLVAGVSFLSAMNITVYENKHLGFWKSLSMFFGWPIWLSYGAYLMWDHLKKLKAKERKSKKK